MGKNFHLSFSIPIFFRFFAMSNANDALGKHIRIGVALTLYLRCAESRKFKHHPDKAIANAHYVSLYFSKLYILTAWASALLILGW